MTVIGYQNFLQPIQLSITNSVLYQKLKK